VSIDNEKNSFERVRKNSRSALWKLFQPRKGADDDRAEQLGSTRREGRDVR
jgi:hypothetical protein